MMAIAPLTRSETATGPVHVVVVPVPASEPAPEAVATVPTLEEANTWAS